MQTTPRLGHTLQDSVPNPEQYRPRRAPADAPNVVLIVLDDLGFAQLGCFGGDIATPHMDLLAANGLRYNRFHVTALCSPTRASLLTGRNSHAVGMGFLSELGLAYPGYTGSIPRSAGTLSRILRDAGYATLAVGKWHLAPGSEQSAAGPFDHWPLGLGFERYYGFITAETNQWTPTLVSDNHYVEPRRTFAEGYHLTEDLVDTAVQLVRDVQNGAPGKPFFLYFAPGAMHAPHQVRPEWVTPYLGTFDGGWERWRERTFARQRSLGVVPETAVLTPRPSWVAAWNDLSAQQQRRYARTQEVYAGFLTHTDAQIGRLLAALDGARTLDNTLVLLISDNGTSAEGGPHGTRNNQARLRDPHEVSATDNLDEWGDEHGYYHYAWGWAWAGNTPFRLWKRYSWLGGTRTPLIVSWPRHIAARGAVRDQFCHAVDLMPTVLDVCGIQAPPVIDGVTQQRIDGRSIAATFDSPSAPSPRDVQYFEVTGSRAIVAGPWKATTDHVGRGNVWEEQLLEGSRAFEGDRWALFNLETDFSEATDVSAEHPEVLERLQETWWFEAGRNNVLPLVDEMHSRAPDQVLPPAYPPRNRSVFLPGGSPIRDRSLPSLHAGGRIGARVEIPRGEAEGILCAIGDWTSGFALYVIDGALVFALSSQGEQARASADLAGVTGTHVLACVLTPLQTGGTRFDLQVDDRVIGSTQTSAVVPPVWQFGGAGLCLGYDRGFPVWPEYTPPFAWTGALHAVIIDVAGQGTRQTGEAIRAALMSE